LAGSKRSRAGTGNSSKDLGFCLSVLAKIARDLLPVQVSTVSSESAFSAGGRVVDPFCSLLDPEMVQALICMKDWVAAVRRGEL